MSSATEVYMEKTFQEDQSIFDSKYYRFYKLISFWAGFWPYQKYSSRKIILLSHLFLSLPIIILQFLYIFVYANTTDEKINGLFMIGVHSFVYFFRINKLYFLNEYFLLHDEVNKDWMYATPDELRILHIFSSKAKSHLRYAYNSTILFYNIIVITSIIPKMHNIIYPESERRKEQYLFETALNVWLTDYYFYLYGYYCIIVTMGMLYVLLFYSMMYMLSFHTGASFGIIGVKLRMIESLLKNDTLYSNISKNECNKCFKQHIKAIKFSDLFCHILEPLLFIGVFLSLMCTATVIYAVQMYANSNDTNEMFRWVPLVICTLNTCFIYCYLGECLIENSSNVRNECYDILWYTFPIPLRRSLNIMQCRCLKNSELNAYGMFVSSLESFIMILQTSFSYFTLMSSIK